jgi:hypothetical protein
MRGQLKEAGGDPGDVRRGGRGAISGEKIGFRWRSGEGKVTRLPGGAGGSAGRCACAGWSGGRWLDWAGLSVTGRETRLRAGLGAWERGERAAGGGSGALDWARHELLWAAGERTGPRWAEEKGERLGRIGLSARLGCGEKE